MSVYDHSHLATSPALDRVDKDQWKESSLKDRIRFESTNRCKTDTDPKRLPNIPVRFSTKNTFLEFFSDRELFSVGTFALFYDSPILKAQGMFIYL